MKDLTERAMKVSFSAGLWRAQRKDRKIGREIAATHNVKETVGHYKKNLIDRAALKPIEQSVNAARMFHYDNTLLWEHGWQLLPVRNFIEYTGKMNDYRADNERAVRQFLADYPRLKAEARQMLNGMYDESEYPSPDHLERKFRWAVEFEPIADPNDLRVQLGRDSVEAIEERYRLRLDEQVGAAMSDCWQRLYEVVRKMGESLRDPKKIFRNSLIGNVQELTGLLTRLNLTEDENLEAMRQEAERELTSYWPDALRESETLRNEAAEKADALARKMLGMMPAAKVPELEVADDDAER